MPSLLSDPRIRWSFIALLSYLTASGLFPFTSFCEYHELVEMFTITNCIVCHTVACFIIFVCCKFLVLTKPIVDFEQDGGYVLELYTKLLLLISTMRFVMSTKVLGKHDDVAADSLVDGTSILICLPLGVFFLSLCRLSLPGFESHAVLVFAGIAARMSLELGQSIAFSTMMAAFSFIFLINYFLSKYGYGVGDQTKAGN